MAVKMRSLLFNITYRDCVVASIEMNTADSGVIGDGGWIEAARVVAELDSVTTRADFKFFTARTNQFYDELIKIDERSRCRVPIFHLKLHFSSSY